MSKIKFLLILFATIFLTSCFGNDDLTLVEEPMGNDTLSSEKCDVREPNELETLTNECDNSYREYISLFPNFINGNGSFLERNSIFTILSIDDSQELFIATDLGSHGTGFYHLNYRDGSRHLQHIEFDFSHTILAYVFRDGVRAWNYVDVFPGVVQGFYKLNNDYFFLTRTSGMSPREAGAIGRLVRKESVEYGDNGYIVDRSWEWHIEKHLILPGSPYTFFLDGENLYIATRSQILLVRNEAVSILADGLSGNGQPNAMDKIGDTLFVRTNHGIWSVDTETSELNFDKF